MRLPDDVRTLSTCVLVTAVVCAGCADGAPDPEMQAYAAEEACKDWVQDELDARSAAKVSVTDLEGDGPWTVSGTVAAVDGAGAMLRASWVCDVEMDGDGRLHGDATLID